MNGIVMIKVWCIWSQVSIKLLSQVHFTFSRSTLQPMKMITMKMLVMMVLLLSTSPLKWAQFSVLSLPLFSALCFSGDRWTLQHSPASGRKLASSTMIPSCCGRFWRSPFVVGRVVRMMRTDSRRRRRCVCWSTFPAADVAAGDRLWCARLDTIAARWLTVRGHAGTWHVGGQAGRAYDRQLPLNTIDFFFGGVAGWFGG